MDAAETLGGAGSAWHDELAHTALTGELDNRAEVQAWEQSGATTSKEYAYTFVTRTADVAKVESTVYPTVQSAMDAVAAGTHTDPTVTILADSREEVTIPENLTVTLDLAGYTLSGLSGSVLTVQSGADLTIRDTSAAQTGAIAHGRGTNIGGIKGGGAYVQSGGTLRLESGTFRENDATYGSAIYIDSNAEAFMTGGSITASTMQIPNYLSGAAVRVGEGHFTMTGGSITDNRTGGIYCVGNRAKLTVTGTPDAYLDICGNQGQGIHTERADCTIEYANISDNNGSGMFLSGTSDIRHCTITDNRTSEHGGGIQVVTAKTCISDTVITNNVATQSGGGIYVVSSLNSMLYMQENVQVYGNAAGDASNDIYIGKNAYFHAASGTAGTAQDTRAAGNMGVPDIVCWYDSTQNVYYVENGNPESESWGVPVQPISYDAAGSLLNKTDQPTANACLTASRAPTLDPVARIGEQTFPTLAAALGAAAESTDAEVTVTLLRDVTESVTLYKRASAPAVTLDLNGYTVSAPATATRVIFLSAGTNLTLTDSSEEKTGALLPGENPNVRAITLNGASFTLLGGTIRDFTVSGADGAAIFASSGSGGFMSDVTIAGGLI